MLISNNSNSVIRAAGEFISPGEHVKIPEYVSDTLDVYSDEGFVKITFSDPVIQFDYKGNLEASAYYTYDWIVTIFTKKSLAEKVRDILSGWNN